MHYRNCFICGASVQGFHRFCNNCYNKKFRENEVIYHKIRNEWRLEAKQESSEYFYFLNEANDIFEGNKNMIIGRKGEGKTAIAKYIYSIKKHNIFTEKISFQNFPFNRLYDTSDNQYTRPNQYISIWKFLTYSIICKQMINNQNINSNITNELRRIFPEADNNKKLSDLISEYKVKQFSLEFFGIGFNTSVEKKIGITWIQLIDVLEKIIIANIDDAKYYILFDELDEDYKSFHSIDEKTNYFDLITGLLKAVQDMRALFTENNLSVYPIVFLRSDIYNRITYSDKNKWSDSIIKLTWTPEKLKALLKHRLNIVLERDDISFKECWYHLFSDYKMSVGSPPHTKRIDTFDYILRSTQNRPRDFIKYFQECVKVAIEGKYPFILPTVIKSADSAFSEYMKNEITDEMYAVLPEYEDIFAILSSIRKQTFKPFEFVDKYEQLVEEGQIPDRGAQAVLKLLFEFSVIGNVPAIKNQAIFKYEKDTARFNFRENIIVHRGLYKALQIF